MIVFTHEGLVLMATALSCVSFNLNFGNPKHVNNMLCHYPAKVALSAETRLSPAKHSNLKDDFDIPSEI